MLPEALVLKQAHIGGIQKLEYNLTVASGPTSPPNDYGIVAVIDGSK